jgi:hypothetical protein
VKKYVGGLVLGLVLGIALSLSAQAPAPAAQAPATAAATAGSLDDVDRMLIQIVSLQAQLANCQSEQLESMKQFSATRAEVVKRIEAKHPGFTIDLQTGKLVPKK